MTLDTRPFDEDPSTESKPPSHASALALCNRRIDALREVCEALVMTTAAGDRPYLLALLAIRTASPGQETSDGS